MGLFFNNKTSSKSNNNVSQFNKWSRVGKTRFGKELQKSGMSYSQRQKVRKTVQDAGLIGTRQFSYNKIFNTLTGNYRLKQKVKSALISPKFNSNTLAKTQKQKNIERNIALSRMFKKPDDLNTGFVNQPTVGFAGQLKR